jgi:hypothetical protein
MLKKLGHILIVVKHFDIYIHHPITVVRVVLSVNKRTHVLMINTAELIVVLPCMLTITQLLLQQNAHFYY